MLWLASKSEQGNYTSNTLRQFKTREKCS
uniref:Uncharacterized protein n=1 Tax=Anguilla anguilla TaxID=7936 RepID=A0A0E9R7J5_ANGAN